MRNNYYIVKEHKSIKLMVDGVDKEEDDEGWSLVIRGGGHGELL